MCVIK